MIKTGDIIQHLKSVLLDAATAAGGNVLVSFDVPRNFEEYPLILIYRLGDDISAEAQSTGEYDWSALVAVTAVVRSRESGSGDGLEPLLDNISKQIHAAVMADPTQGGNCHDTMPLSVDYVPWEEGNQPHAAARITYLMLYDSE